MPRIERCTHAIGGVERCRYCKRRICPTCHHAPAHLAACEQTRRRETRT